MAWAASFFFWRAEALSLVTPSYLLSSCQSTQSNERFFGARRGLRFNKCPIRLQGNTITELGHHRRRGNKHIGHNKHHRPIHPSSRITVQQITRILQQVTPRKMSKASVETELTHLLLTVAVSFSSFSPSLFFLLLFSFPLPLSPLL